MERTVTFRVYDVVRQQTTPNFELALEHISRIALAERLVEVGTDGAAVRLEDYAVGPDFAEGQFARAQSANMPGRLMPTGSENLPFDEPLSHCMCFRFRPSDATLVMQFDNRVLSPHRASEYVAALSRAGGYTFRPRLRSDAWERFNRLPVRKLTFSVAGHPAVANLEDEERAAYAAVDILADAYRAQTVRVELSMGRKKGALDAAARAVAQRLWRQHEQGETDLRALKGTVQKEDGSGSEEIDLIDELLSYKVEIFDQGKDQRRFYELKRLHLRAILESQPIRRI